MQGKLTDGGRPDRRGHRRPGAASGCGEDAFFWLDLEGLDAETGDLLPGGFGFHPLAVEDAEHFGQRPKVDDYDGFTYLVVHGARAARRGPRPPRSTSSMRRATWSPCTEATAHLLDGVRERLERHRAAAGSSPGVSVLYLVVDELVDSYFPVLAQLDDRIDALEDAILKQPTEAQLGELFDMKRTLVALRKVVTPERDMFARAALRDEHRGGDDPRGRALLPRPLRPPDPDQRPGGLATATCSPAPWTPTSRPSPTGSTW